MAVHHPQVLKTDTASRILLAAPSNSAADLLAALVLRSRPRSELLRVCAYQRPKQDIPAELLDVTNYDEGSDAFLLPAKARVQRAGTRVVVTTCLMACKVLRMSC